MTAPIPAFQRARSPEAKAARRRALLEAAGALLDEDGPEAVTLAAIAERAGVVKSGVYRYFESREHILLRLCVADLEELASVTEGRLAPLAGSCDAEATARIVARGFAERPRLCRLAGALTTVLERNVGDDTLLETKRDMLAAAGRFAVAGRAACPSVGPENWGLFVRLTFSLAAAHWTFANPPPAVARVLARPEFEPLRKPFEDDLARGLAAMLRGFAQGPG